MNKNVLSGISAMWYGNPSAVCFIGSVMRLMEYLGDPVEEDELFALSGVGLSFPWRFASCCDEVSIIPEVPFRTFEALGYKSEHLKDNDVSDKTVCFDKIKQSIDKGRPVIGIGITTKNPMACLISGYDEGGLYTRSFFSTEGEKHDIEKYFYSTDWHENCSGLLFVGDKINKRFKGKTAYDRIVWWAEYYRWKYKSQSVTSEGQEIFLNENAFEEMIKWLLDEGQWVNIENQEQYLKQMGLLLFSYYRYQLHEYLKKLEAETPGLVNKPVFAVLEKIGEAIPGAHTSDLWLHEAVDPMLKGFSVMRERSLREKTAKYVRMLQGLDNSVQWTLFMPDFVKNQKTGFDVENFEYREFSAMRFIGGEGEEFNDLDCKIEVVRTLDTMNEYKSGFDYDIAMMHHSGKNLDGDAQFHCVWGRFMKANTPVPDGLVSIDFVPHDVPEAGPPYYSQFAFAKFSGDIKAMHESEGFDCDGMYDVTRNIVLGDGVCIPYPEKYWTAEVFLNGFDKPNTGYLFSTGGKNPGQ